MSELRKWDIGVDAPPRCGDCQSSAAAECWHRPKCPVCGFKLIDPAWCSGCDAAEQPAFDALAEAVPLPASWSPNGWNYADAEPRRYPESLMAWGVTG